MDDLTVPFRGKPLGLTLSEAEQLLADLTDQIQHYKANPDGIRPPSVRNNGRLGREQLSAFFAQIYEEIDALNSADMLFAIIVWLAMDGKDDGVEFAVICCDCGQAVGARCTHTRGPHVYHASSNYEVSAGSLKQQFDSFMGGSWPSVTQKVKDDMALLVSAMK